MHRSSPVRRALALLLGLALFALSRPGPARAADNKFDTVAFDTVDGVTLKGSFYKSAKGKDEPTVLFLHKLGSDSHKDGWDDLAKALNDKGYSVLSFDFRGHGGSTSVDPQKFWSYTWNRELAHKSGPTEKGKPRETISREAFVSSGYYRYLVNDIAAAKMFLDERNDAGDCNSRALILIGAEDGAALGALWMAADWNRYSADKVILDPRGPRFPALITGVSKESEGKDQYCAVWLSMSPNLGGKVSVNGALKADLKLVGREKKVPMAFLYGQEDREGEEHAKAYLQSITGGSTEVSDKLPNTAMRAVKSTKLAGSALLRKNLGTDELILGYLGKTREKHVVNKWKQVESDRTAYVWVVPGLVRPVPAKEEKGKALEPIPPAVIGLAQ
ncbi:MAG TPA: alpha/beta hydrolase [Gemmataceae bacterium]|nr:alpha/beta hydrolase [Gemmataceae bacterium]